LGLPFFIIFQVGVGLAKKRISDRTSVFNNKGHGCNDTIGYLFCICSVLLWYDVLDFGSFNHQMINKGVYVMKKGILLMLFAGFIFLPGNSIAEGKPDQYAQTIKLFKGSPASKKFFDTAYGYAVLPVIGKGGVGVGGSFGTGKVYRGDKVTGRVTMAKLSIGFQLGGQAFSEVIFFQDKRAYEEFVSGTFEFDAMTSAVAITAGAQAKAGTTGKSAGASAGPGADRQLVGKYVKGMAVFVHIQGGLMYEATIGGQAFSFEKL